MPPKRSTSTASSSSSSSKRVRKQQQQQQQQPPEFIRLFHLFTQLNTFCAFCDARLTTAITLDKIQSAVNGVQLDDLAAINVIIPDFIHFDQGLTIQFGKPMTKKRESPLATRGGRGEGSNQYRSPPSVKPEVVKKTIDARNLRFKRAIANFVSECQDKHIDPVAHLKQEIPKHIPPPSSSSTTSTTTTTTTITIDNTPSTTTSSSPSSMKDTIDQLQQQPFYHHQLVHCREFTERPSVYGDPIDLPHEIESALHEKGILHLYVHQTEAIRGLREDQHVIVATSTASGKSLIYQIPVLERLIHDKNTRAMYIFPTKALAQDQMRALQELIGMCPSLEDVQVATFDGDTPSEQRAFIRDNANIIFTNPDMLHHSILPNGKRWRSFLCALRFVVLDELHIYNGLFGANVAFIMRRLRRWCHHYDNDTAVQFISCSATIRHADEHMKLVCGIDQVKLVEQDGAPCGKKSFLVWNPPLVKRPGQNPNERRGSVAEGAQVLEYLLSRNVRTIAFCKVRKTCELLMMQLRDSLEKQQRGDLLGNVMSYRGGYLPMERRQIEKRLFNGDLLAVVATNALELGVDIGSLDAVVMIGMPWTISALWQQSGRAGRRNKDSLSMVITDHNPMDQHFARHPEELFEQPLDDIQFDVENNKLVLESHLQCAAEELPINIDQDQAFFGPNVPQVCEEHLMLIHDKLYRPDPRYRPYPSQHVNIRNITQELYAVINTTDGKNIVLEEIESTRAPFEIYEGAVYIHQGRTYLVEECNVDQRYAKVHAARVDYTTQQRDFTNANAITTVMSKPIQVNEKKTRNRVSYGRIQIETIVFGYYRMDKRNRIIDNHDIYMDPIIRQSTGIWLDVPPVALKKMDELEIDRMASIHGAAHAMISLLPSFASSTAADIRTECKSPHATRPRPPRIVLYESQPSGIVRQAYQFIDELLEMCVEQIQNCACEDGCPACVHLSQCSEHNELCSKHGALIVLQSLKLEV